MTTEADGVHGTPHPFAPKIVAGTDHSPDSPLSLLNQRIFDPRYWIWCKAEAATKYCRSPKDFQSELEDAQLHEIAEGRLYPAAERDARISMIHEYRKTLARQLRTSAWSTSTVTWKRAVLACNNYVFNGYIEKACVEKAVADDLAFPAAHPVKEGA